MNNTEDYTKPSREQQVITLVSVIADKLLRNRDTLTEMARVQVADQLLAQARDEDVAAGRHHYIEMLTSVAKQLDYKHEHLAIRLADIKEKAGACK